MFCGCIIHFIRHPDKNFHVNICCSMYKIILYIIKHEGMTMNNIGGRKVLFSRQTHHLSPLMIFFLLEIFLKVKSNTIKIGRFFFCSYSSFIIFFFGEVFANCKSLYLHVVPVIVLVKYWRFLLLLGEALVPCVGTLVHLCIGMCLLVQMWHLASFELTFVLSVSYICNEQICLMTFNLQY